MVSLNRLRTWNAYATVNERLGFDMGVYFCTCDDKLIKRSREIDDLHTKVVLPTELVRELGL